MGLVCSARGWLTEWSALFGLSFFIVLVRSSMVTCLSLNGGCLGWSCLIASSCCGSGVYFGIVWLVLSPTVMKKSLNALAMSWGLVCVLFSYVMMDGDCLSWFLDGMTDLSILLCCLGSCFVF